ncbi:MAG: stress response translation initiation inhibitor YciH [Chloroflexi bacterium]|nr:stress response translation initiation inhibitor YciH [Chloroflexota bacterium]
MERRVVYDSDAQRPGHCPTCGKRLDRCTCGQGRPAPRVTRADPKLLGVPRDGVVRLLRDRKSRGGKIVTLITGLPGPPAALAALASDLKRLCGTGGTLRGDILEIQGDFRDRLQAELERRGYKVKLAGG